MHNENNSGENLEKIDNPMIEDPSDDSESRINSPFESMVDELFYETDDRVFFPEKFLTTNPFASVLAKKDQGVSAACEPVPLKEEFENYFEVMFSSLPVVHSVPIWTQIEAETGFTLAD